MGLVRVGLGVCTHARPLPKILLSAAQGCLGRKVLRDKHVQCREEMERFTFFKSKIPKPQSHSTLVCRSESHNSPPVCMG